MKKRIIFAVILYVLSIGFVMLMDWELKACIAGVFYGMITNLLGYIEGSIKK